MPRYQPLSLIAGDADDLKAVSALMQDAIVKVGDAAFLKNERRFALVANRFVWETAKKGLFNRPQRVRAGLHFDDVTAVRALSVRLDAPEAVIDILSIDFEGGENGGTITLRLAGGGEIALDVEAINATLRDLSEPWPASRMPDHETETST